MARFTASGAAVAAMVVVSSNASAAVNSVATGEDLVGGIVTVSWWSSGGGAFLGNTVGVFGSPAAGVGVAEIADPFGTTARGAVLRVAGDTFLTEWTLQNNGDAIIGAIEIDLNPSLSLFDDDSSPSTAGSFAGRDDVVYVPGSSTAPAEIDAFEFDSWIDPANTGDMYQQERIEWNISAIGDTFDFGEVYSWRDDTDVIPAPGAGALIGVAGVAAQRRRRG